jgi:Ca-activated chloride channel family protein
MQKLRRCLPAATIVLGTLLATWLGGWLAAASAEAADPGSMMIIVDGSGSMAGLLEPKGRQPKIALVRDSLRAALSSTDPQARIGLVAFGHRHGGCNDVEIVRTPQAAHVDRVLAPLAQIRPRGKGALTLAVREAARQLPGDPGPRSVLLLHDGPDNCQQDVCAAAAELLAAGVAAHVVSLGIPAEDLGKIACLPHTTGGRHFKVDTAEQAVAAIAEAVRAASGELSVIAGLGPAVPVPGSGAVVPPAPIPATGRSALHLRALATAGSEALSLPLNWIVSRTAEPGLPLFDAWAANPVVPVEPGSYLVAVRGELVSASRSVTVQEGRPAVVPIALGAGMVRVRVAAQKTSAPISDAIITIAGADGAPLAVSKAGEAAVLLPPGRYRVGAELGLVRAERAVSVEEGRATPVDVTLSVGRLQLTAEVREGPAAPEPALFIVMEDDPPRGRREVARSAAGQAEFALPPGTYYVIARQGSVEARERLEIGSGDVVRRTLSAATGRLGLSTHGAGRLALAAR